MDGLPDDVLYNIFLFVVHDDPDAALTLAHVCVRWRLMAVVDGAIPPDEWRPSMDVVRAITRKGACKPSVLDALRLDSPRLVLGAVSRLHLVRRHPELVLAEARHLTALEAACMHGAPHTARAALAWLTQQHPPGSVVWRQMFDGPDAEPHFLHTALQGGCLRVADVLLAPSSPLFALGRSLDELVSIVESACRTRSLPLAERVVVACQRCVDSPLYAAEFNSRTLTALAHAGIMSDRLWHLLSPTRKHACELVHEALSGGYATLASDIATRLDYRPTDDAPLSWGATLTWTCIAASLWAADGVDPLVSGPEERTFAGCRHAECRAAVRPFAPDYEKALRTAMANVPGETYCFACTRPAADHTTVNLPARPAKRARHGANGGGGAHGANAGGGEKVLGVVEHGQ
jgi:hypothetical protein